MVALSVDINKGIESPYHKPLPQAQIQERKERKEQVAAGVGGAAGLSTTATKYASRQGLKAEAEEHVLQQMMQTVTNTTNAVNKNTEAAQGLWATFRSNIKMYTKDIMTRLEHLKNSKFIGPIINSPVTKKLAGVAGGALAFFVLVTGVNKAVKTGAIAVDDFKHQFHEFNS